VVTDTQRLTLQGLFAVMRRIWQSIAVVLVTPMHVLLTSTIVGLVSVVEITYK